MLTQRPRSPLALSDDELKSPLNKSNNNNSHRQEWDLPITKLDQMKHASTLSTLNVPRTDFLKALNFERFSARSRLLSEDGTKAEAKVQTSLSSEEESEEEEEEDEAEEEEEDEQEFEENESDEEAEDENQQDESLDEDQLNDSDAENRAPSRQDQELDQAELIAKFKELRDLQLQEQQLMMLEQQSQLDKLRLEQQRVQDMLMQEQIAALSPHKLPQSRNTSMNSSLKIKLINSPVKNDSNGSKIFAENDFDYNHNRIRKSTSDDNLATSEVDEATSEHEVTSEHEDVDQDYLQCSMVETEAEAHVNHVEDLLRNSRDLFGSKEGREATSDTGRTPVERTGEFSDEFGKRRTPANLIIENRSTNVDEKPVSGARKTFEELLEEKLRLESSTPTAPSSGLAKKRPFLKRGQGTARFGTTPPVVGKSTPRTTSPTKNTAIKKTTSTAPANEVVLKVQRPVAKRSPVKQKVLNEASARIGKRTSMETNSNSAKKTRLDDVEFDDIEEFELLEKYADDDYSFTSNCSIIKARPTKMKKYVVGFGNLNEENNESNEGERLNGALTPELTSGLPLDPPSSTPRRLKRKIASKIGPTTTVEKDVLVEDFSPSVGENASENGLGSESDDNFDDEDTWANTIPEPNFARASQSAAVKTEAPPTSKLVARLFPSLKAQPKPEAAKPVTSSTTEGVMSKALKDKLLELEAEIDKFRQENGVIAKIKKERLEGLEALKNEVEQFERKKETEMQDIHEMRETEMKKIRNERKMFEKYQKEMRAIPDKNQRREIEELNAEIAELKDEMRQKETRWSSSTNRLRNRIENLEKENSDLQEEVKIVEKQRLELWQKELLAKNDKKKKTQFVPPQQQKVQEADENSASEALRQQFDKLLRASLDDVRENEAKEESVKPKAQKKSERTAVRNSESQPRQQKISKTGTEGLNPTGGKANAKSTNHNAKKTEVKIDLGDGNYREIRHKDGKVEHVFNNGSKEVVFANGSRKRISPDGESVIVSFFNGDIKQILPDQRVVYYYADSRTKHTTYPDGIEILEFPNEQVEKHYPNGTREILFPDQTVKYLYPGGAEESVFADGTVVKIEKNGDRVMNFPNGQKEIHTKDHKRREYPDGTTKTVYPDGRQETRYSSGRVRVKDVDGNILVDKVC